MKSEDDYIISSTNNQSFDNDFDGELFFFRFLFLYFVFLVLDFCSSNDERIKGYLIYQNWNDELQDANENRWIVDKSKFNEKTSIAKE